MKPFSSTWSALSVILLVCTLPLASPLTVIPECTIPACEGSNWKSLNCYFDTNDNTNTTCKYYRQQRCAGGELETCFEPCNITSSACEIQVKDPPRCGNNLCEVGEPGVCNSDCGWNLDGTFYGDNKIATRCPGLTNLEIQPNGWKNKRFALTFQDGPSQYTGRLLDILSKYNVTATFFVVGSSMKDTASRSTIIRMIKEGHIVGSHTYNHFNVSQNPVADLYDDAAYFDLAWADLMAELANDAPTRVYKPRFFRPHFGILSQAAIDYYQTLGFQIVMWNLDSQDYKNTQNGFQILQNVKDNLEGHPGNQHVIYSGHDLTSTAVEATEWVIKEFINQGFSNVGLDECLFGQKGKSIYGDASRNLTVQPLPVLIVPDSDSLLIGSGVRLIPMGNWMMVFAMGIWWWT